MTQFQTKVLSSLLEKYEHSNQSHGGGVKERAIKLDRKTSPLDLYLAPDAIQHRLSYDRDIEKLEKEGFLLQEKDKDGQVVAVRLMVREIERLYFVMGRKSPKDACASLLKVLECHPASGCIGAYATYIRSFIASHYRIPKSYVGDGEELEMQLRCLERMQLQKEEIMERDFSMAVFGDSKKFSPLIPSLCRIVRDFDEECPYEGQSEILEYFNIVRNTTYALVRGKLCFQLGEQEIDLGKMGYEFAFSDAMIESMRLRASSFKRVVTIENLTTWRMYQDPQAILIYLAGFHDKGKQMLLMKIHDAFPDKEYLHYSDIDVGGMLIWRHLVERTSIPFEPLHMGVKELEERKTCTKALTVHDRQRLLRMKDDVCYEPFFPVIAYMLAHDVKLEQESLD